MLTFCSLLLRDKIIKQEVPVSKSQKSCKVLAKARSVTWLIGDTEQLCGHWLSPYPIGYITVTCLVAYVDLRFILLNSFSVAVHFCSVQFCFFVLFLFF